MIKRNMNKTFTHYFICEHFHLGQSDLHLQWWLFNIEINKCHDPINMIILNGPIALFQLYLF